MTTTSTIPPSLTALDLLTRGYFHDRVIPPINSKQLEAAFDDIVAHTDAILAKPSAKNKFSLGLTRSRAGQHSVPKRKHSRRILSHPNPLPYSMLCRQVESAWPLLKAACASPVSMSVPELSTTRSVMSAFGQRTVSDVRAERSIGKRFLLKTDLVRFYPSIYTHSLPWVLHGKSDARKDKKNTLIGNRLDVCVRETQDQQTGGILIGPDTSFILGEMVGAYLDGELKKRMSPIGIQGIRFIDDFYLYFDSRADAEKAIAELHGAARSIELEINEFKTEIIELPESIEPSWKTSLRLHNVAINDQGISIKALFDRANELANAYPGDSIFTYVAKKLLFAGMDSSNWSFAETHLYRSVMAEPSMLPQLHALLTQNGISNFEGLTQVVNALCRYHAPLQHGLEVAWCLWISRSFAVSLGAEACAAISLMTDDIVALAALDANYLGYTTALNTDLWASWMTAENLYTEHWLVAYEALRKNWLVSTSGLDYVSVDPFFSILAANDVEFYDSQTTATAVESGYGDESASDDLELEDTELEGIIEDDEIAI